MNMNRRITVVLAILVLISFTVSTAYAQVIPWGLSSVGALKMHRSGYTGQAVRVGIVGRGIDTNHRDLLIAGGSSYDYDTYHAAPESIDRYTWNAGIFAARDNQYDILGVSPDVELFIYRAGPSTWYDEISYAMGIYWCIENDMDIIFLDFSTHFGMPYVEPACQEAADNGILLVARADDHFWNPGKFASVMAVGAIDSSYNRPSWGPVGSQVEILAPGVDIKSLKVPHGVKEDSSTGAAAAYVVGVAALIKSMKPEWPMSYIRQRIIDTALDVGYTVGVANAYRAVPRLNLSLSTNGTYYLPYDYIEFTATVWNSIGRRVSGAEVSMRVYYGNHYLCTLTATTNKDGIATMGFGPTLTGPYTFVAEVHSPGYALGEATTGIYVYDPDDHLPQL